MAVKLWTGNGQDTAQVHKFTPANVGIGDIFTLTINGKSISFTATAATVANVTAGLTALWTASLIPEFTRITARDATTYIDLTAKEIGEPFTATSGHTDGDATATETITGASITANSSKNDLTNVGLVDGDDFVIDGFTSNVPILWGLDQSTIDLASLKIINNYGGRGGNPVYNPLGFAEYRGTELTFGTVTELEVNSPSLQQFKLNVGSNKCTLNLYAGVLEWRGTHADNVVNVYGGTLKVAMTGDQVATIDQLRQLGGEVQLSSGVTLSNKPEILGGTFRSQL